MPESPKILKVAFTKGDASTLPGGIILRQMPDGMYCAHTFSRKPGTLDPIGYFWGSYHETEANAAAAFSEKHHRSGPSVVTKAWILNYEAKS